MKTNYHTHTYLCKHAVGNVEDYIKRAIDRGYDIIGMSDHAPLTPELAELLHTRRMDQNEYFTKYLPELIEAQEKYSDKIEIFTGLEIEWFDVMKDCYPEFLKDLDYLILGQHYFLHDGKYYSVYGQLTPEMVESYADDVCKAMETGYFRILAHPDLYCWGYPMWDDFSAEIAEKIIRCAMKNDVLLEFNANGIRNCEKRLRFTLLKSEDKSIVHNYAYPKKEFFELCSKLGAKVILNDDCHDPLNLDDDATAFARKLIETLNLNVVDHVANLKHNKIRDEFK